MGKESRLRNTRETRTSYTNGDRKFFDSSAAPAGADEYVWSLALYFEQRLEPFGGKSMTPVTYTRLYERVAKDADLTNLLSPATIHTSSKGEGGRPLVTSGTKVHSKQDIITNSNKYLLLERMIDKYYDSYDSNSLPSIEDFTSYSIFNNLKLQVVEEEFTRILKTTGTRNTIHTTGIQPDRRGENVKEVLDITVNKVYSEEDIEKAFNRFRRES